MWFLKVKCPLEPLEPLGLTSWTEANSNKSMYEFESMNCQEWESSETLKIDSLEWVRWAVTIAHEKLHKL